ncbi:MAG TPA: hypothetical protein VKA67_12350, partial [Verrucomicrobiae bacterium]|nr:hypothetical protein [Verrucomicrobiae bacterium]
RVQLRSRRCYQRRSFLGRNTKTNSIRLEKAKNQMTPFGVGPPGRATEITETQLTGGDTQEPE